MPDRSGNSEAHPGEDALRLMLRGLALLIFLSVFGCGAPLTEAQIQATAEAKLLQDVVDKLQAGDLQAVRLLLDSQTNSLPETPKALEQSAEMLPDESAKSTEYLNWWMNTNTDSGRTSGVSAHIEYPTRWVLVTASFAGQPETMRVTGFQVQYALKGQDNVSPFTATATGPNNGLNLASAWMAVAVLLVAAIACVLVRGLNKKWLWMVFILFCTPGIYVEPAKQIYMFNFIDFGWANGAWFQPQSGLHLIVPLGAIFFFLKWWTLRKPFPDQPASSSP
jgi:hypothetical protein